MFQQFAILYMSSFGPIQNAINLLRILQFSSQQKSGSISSAFQRIIV